ncbi:hypothetical protein Y032_0045g1096 [Ancylostoma ceylanicum]|uniref:Secreted protein n=1 Tax=Ancylostoma ceylanicum TaxID=53326 RepID=A0A016UCY8_9BILA|nr:hypothetical protein Y032_0045g1096 [Ancylostoma ceylanicum]
MQHRPSADPRHVALCVIIRVLYHPLALATVSIKVVKVPSVGRVTRTALRSPVDQGEHYMTSECNSVSRTTLTERRILIR